VTSETTAPPAPSPASPHAAIVAARGLTLSFGSGDAAVEVLRGVDLSIAAGETVALLGPSGSGKSSLMAVLAGLERATAGSLIVAGADFAALDEDALARARRGRIGIVLQAFHLLPTMTALENVATPLELAGDADGAADRARGELEAVGLGHRLDHYPAQLSGGEQQRVAIARATVARPALLFADEPTGNLDTATGAELMVLLRELHAEDGTTIVVITHDRDVAAMLPRRIDIRDGRIERDSGPARDPGPARDGWLS